MPGKPRSALLGGAALAAVLVAVPLARADSVSLSVGVQTPGQGIYSGKVKTKQAGCEKKRTVQVFDLSQPTPLFIGQTVTDTKGKYELQEFAPVTGSQVMVVVPQKNKHNKKCPAVQKTATAPAPPAP